MARIIRLTERDLSNLVRRVIREEEEQDEIAGNVESILNKPKVEMKIEDIYSNLSDDEKRKLESSLNNLGIDEYTSPKEAHDAVQNVADNVGGEIGEGDENMDPKEKVADILHGIGEGNIAAFGGVPAAILIGGLLAGTVGSPFVAGLAISWGVTSLLMGLAKLLAKDKSKEDQPESEPKLNNQRSNVPDGTIFNRRSDGSTYNHQTPSQDNSYSTTKKTIDEDYRMRKYRRRY
jgi:hypothetical protein